MIDRNTTKRVLDAGAGKARPITVGQSNDAIFYKGTPKRNHTRAPPLPRVCGAETSLEGLHRR